MDAYKALSEYCQALVDAGEDALKIKSLEIEEVGRIARLRKLKQAHDLLPLGPAIAMERAGCKKSTLYWRARKWRSQSKKIAKT